MRITKLYQSPELQKRSQQAPVGAPVFTVSHHD